ncbi:Protein OPY2 [Phlyctema vagabunda]|uniref:Protein OPY2 n=1 Tax=Phlyctema vagabunda TaxID=108571 RepID=A0ABR4PMR4_9HELO
MSVYEASFHTLFRRCVTGCATETPSCPTCPDGQICQLIPPSCDACQSTTCVASASSSSNSSPSSSKSDDGPNTGAIAGGVIGGVLAIAIITYLVWRFCIKTKRQQYEQEDWIQDHGEEDDGLPAEKDFTMRRDARASTHTVGSIASTVLTRASNIIQIAYIPGVTNRSAPSTPGLLVPPVPPIPIALSSAASSPRYEDEHFFMPGDLRDSTYSGISDRTSYARNSVASTIYGKNAIVSPVPAQTVIRGKAAVVSVRSAGHSPGELTPPVPSVDYGKYAPPSPAFSVGSTFLNNANAATQVRPHVVSVASSGKRTPTAEVNPSSQSYFDRDSKAVTLIDDTPSPEQGPFRDPPETPQSGTSLSAVIEEATKKSQGSAKKGSRKRDSTPFGDEHEMRD